MSFAFLTLKHKRCTDELVSLLGLKLKKPPSVPVQHPCAVNYDYLKKQKEKKKSSRVHRSFPQGELAFAINPLVLPDLLVLQADCPVRSSIRELTLYCAKISPKKSYKSFPGKIWHQEGGWLLLDLCVSLKGSTQNALCKYLVFPDGAESAGSEQWAG